MITYIPQTEISSSLSPPTGDPGFESVSLKEQKEGEEMISGDEKLQVAESFAELQEKGQYLKGDVHSQKGQFEDISLTFGEFEEQEAGKEMVVSEATKEAEDNKETFDDETQFCLQVSCYHAVALDKIDFIDMLDCQLAINA